MNAEHLSLSRVIDEFKQWRASRKKQSRIPNYLWKQVILLLSNHPKSIVLGRLGISNGQLKNHMNLQSSKLKSKVEVQCVLPISVCD